METQYINNVVNEINLQWGCNVLFIDKEQVKITPILWNFLLPTLHGPMSLKMLFDQNSEMKVEYKHILGIEKCLYLSIGYENMYKTFIIYF